MREVLYGRQPVLEMLKAGRRNVFSLKIRGSVRPTDDLGEIARLARQAGIRVDAVDHQALNRLVDEGHHQGVAAEVSDYPVVDFGELTGELASLGEDALVLALDHIQDPQNLGALLRVADAAGVHGVVIPADRAVRVTPAVVRASAGAAEHMRVAVVTNLVRTMKALKEAGLWCAGLEACDAAKPYTEADLGGPLALVVGSEGEGLGRLVSETCDFLVKLPLYGRVTSLNAAAAGAVALYEIRRQRDSRKKAT
jgi:23S rRNA (guanosine2251-2'-O)-methyltransferase